MARLTIWLRVSMGYTVVSRTSLTVTVWGSVCSAVSRISVTVAELKRVVHAAPRVPGEGHAVLRGELLRGGAVGVEGEAECPVGDEVEALEGLGGPGKVHVRRVPVAEGDGAVVLPVGGHDDLLGVGPTRR